MNKKVSYLCVIFFASLFRFKLERNEIKLQKRTRFLLSFFFMFFFFAFQISVALTVLSWNDKMKRRRKIKWMRKKKLFLSLLQLVHKWILVPRNLQFTNKKNLILFNQSNSNANFLTFPLTSVQAIIILNWFFELFHFIFLRPLLLQYLVWFISNIFGVSAFIFITRLPFFLFIINH